MKRHNGVISLWKFVFSLMVLYHHMYEVIDPSGVEHPINCGAIAVDFFFLVSGYLMTKKVAETEESDGTDVFCSTKDYLFRKIRGLFPYLLFSTVLFAVMHLLTGDRGKMDYLLGFVDLTFLQMAGLPDRGFVGGAWYLSAMLLGMWVLYPLNRKYGRRYRQYIAPSLGIFILCYLSHASTSMRQVKAWVGICQLGLWKAIAELALGAVVFELSSALGKIEWNQRGRKVLSAAEMILLGFVIAANSCGLNVRRLDWVFIPMLMAGAAIAFSEKTALYEACCNRASFFLEKLSLPLYLNNYIGIYIVNHFGPFPGMAYSAKCMAAAVIDILLSLVEMPIVAKADEIFKKGWDSIWNSLTTDQIS